VLVPSRPGITNALGCVVADLRHDYVNTINKPLSALEIGDVHALFDTQASEGRGLIEKENVQIEELREIYSVDMQFIGQTHLLRVPLPGPRPSLDDLQTLFEKTYFNRFHVELPEIKASLVNVNCSVIGRRSEIDLSLLIDPSGRKASIKEAMTGRRRVWFEGETDTPIYWRDHLPLDAEISGPAIIEQMDTTIVIDPGDKAVQDPDGNIIIELGAGA
jgi:N-methylhydantoinase A